MKTRGHIIAFPRQTRPFRELARVIQPVHGLRPADWHQHSNGGGWVQQTARVALTAYVGPFAIVGDNAVVLDDATITDEALVTGTAVVAGRAVIGDRARVSGAANITGNARVLGTAEIGGRYTMTEGTITSGTYRRNAPGR